MFWASYMCSSYNLIFTHWCDFCPWLFCSVLFIACPQSDAICHFCNNLINLSGQIKFPLCLETSSSKPFLPRRLPFAVCPHLPTCLLHPHLPFPVLHVSLLSSLGLSYFFSVENSSVARAFSPPLPFSSCSVLPTLDIQYMFDDWELYVDFSTVFNRVS